MSERSSKFNSPELVLVYVVLSLVVAVAPLATLLWISDRPEVRYRDDYSDLRQAIFEHEGRVDVAFGGSSRVRRGLFEPFHEEALAPYFGGRRPVVYNVGVAGDGTDAQIRVLLELLERREVHYIFLQLYRMRENRFPTHRNLRKFGTLEDILWTPIEGYGLAEATSHRLQLLYQRISEMLDNCVSMPSSCWREVRTMDAESTRTSAPRSVDVERQKRFLVRREKKRGGEYFRFPPRSWSFEASRDARTAHYLDRLIAKARDKGTTVVFVDLAKFEWDTLADGFPEYVERRFGVDYLYLSADELRDLGEGGGFGDYGHVNIRGEPVLRHMIVDYFKRRPIEIDDASTSTRSSRGS